MTTHSVNILELVSISNSIAAIFSALEGWREPPKRKDMMTIVVVVDCGEDDWGWVGWVDGSRVDSGWCVAYDDGV